MPNYLDLIFVGPEQALPILVAVVLWIGLAGLGSLFTSKDRIVEANVIFGWAIISGVFTIIGVIVEQPLFILSVLLGILALFGIFRAAKSGQHLFIPGMWRVLVLALPILWIAGAMEPSQWDEFSHWLPAPKYILEFNGFPNNERPFLGPHMLPGYPYGWPFLSYLSAQIAGQFVANIPGILNLFLIFSFVTLALRTGFHVAGREGKEQITWPFATAVVLFGTIFNPTFVQKIVLTAYSDASTSVITGFGLLIGYFFLETLAKRRAEFSWNSAWQFGLVLSLLVNVRQANLVLAVVLLVAITILALRDTEISKLSYVKHLVLVTLPLVLVYVAWRYYLANDLDKVAGAEATFRAITDWNYSEVPLILKGMGYVAFKKIAFFGPLLIACYFAALGLIRYRSNFDRLAVLIACVFLGYTSFLFLTYVGHFQPRTAITVVSFWRYSTHNGMVAVTFITIGLIYLLNARMNLAQFPKWIKVTSLLLVLVLPFAFSHKLRFDLEPPKPHFTKVAKDLKKILPKDASLFVMDPNGTGESNKITFFHLNIFGSGYFAAFHGVTSDKVRAVIKGRPEGSYLLVHSKFDGLSESLGQLIEREKSYLMHKKDEKWETIRDWQKPENHKW